MMQDRGSFTFIAIVYTMVITIIAISISYYIRTRLSDIEAFNIKMDAYLNIRSYINILNFCLSNGNLSYSQIDIPLCQGVLDTTRIPLDGTPVKIKDDIYASVQDTNGLISLWSGDTQALKNLVINLLGFSDTQADSFVSSLLDWIDTDDLKRVNGAERFDYTQGYKPRNYFFQYGQEVALVKGMNIEDYRKIKKFITIMSNYGFNPNTAPPEVLSAYMNIDIQTAQKVVEYRKTRNITGNSELFALTGKIIDLSKEGIYFFPYNSFVVEITYYRQGRKVMSAQMGVSYKSGSYNIIYVNIE